MKEESPLIQAVRNRVKPQAKDSSKEILEFILSHFSLTPKVEEGPKEMNVTTQESHTP